MSMSSKFLTESTGEKIVKLVNIWRRYGQSTIAGFLGHPIEYGVIISIQLCLLSTPI